MPEQDDPKQYEIRPDPQGVTGNEDPSKNSSTGVDYEPHPEKSIKLSPERQHIVDSITRLYSGSASESDMSVYAEKSVYDDPWSYCDTRYKIAGQWYGIPKLMAKSQTLKTENVEDKPDRIVFKLQQEYTPKVVQFSKAVNSLITLTLDENDKVKYHKDMWNHKDYSHEGLGKIMKTLNGDHLTKITQPPNSL
ncbi:hypothetical protein LTR10_008537 [Elasticomyces elasticus]|nr:hypothetical protein LTR10_008537 [Elasticomyces elasticus]KAK4967410.1 hypothetical protein LTR42_010759 [Elasticomyces elasticus]